MSKFRRGKTAAGIPGFHPFKVRKLVRQINKMTDEEKEAFVKWCQEQQGYKITKKEVVS